MAAIAVLDYGGGNLGSLTAALVRRSADFVVTADPAVITAARAVVFPGDGAFGATMAALDERGLSAAATSAITAGTPFLAICVGLQCLYEASDEFGAARGFGVLPGRVQRFSAMAPRIPHMGWNDVQLVGSHPFTEGLADGDFAYFLHSYRVEPDRYTLATSMHGEPFAAIIARDNLMATQFHPEKSGRVGGMLLDNFLRIVG